MEIVILRSNPVNPDPRVEKIANSLIKTSSDITILAWDRKAENSKYKDNITELKLKNGFVNIKRFSIRASFGNGLKTLFPLLLFQISLLKWLMKNRKHYHVIHACDFDTVIPAWICSKLFRKKYVYDIFDYYVDAFRVPAKLKKIIEKIDIYMMNHADTVIITNENRLGQISKSSPKELSIIHNSPDINLVNLNNNVLISPRGDKVKFVYVGILGSGRLLKEIMDIFKNHPEWELHIGGFGHLEEFIKNEANKNDNIKFYGKIPYNEVIKLEMSCDILFAVYDPKVANNRFSSPNKLYEAMMLGKPIIVGEHTGIDKIVLEKKLGQVTDYSAKGFEYAAEEICSQLDSNRFDHNHSIRVYNEEYSWGIMEGRLLSIYNDLV